MNHVDFLRYLHKIVEDNFAQLEESSRRRNMRFGYFVLMSITDPTDDKFPLVTLEHLSDEELKMLTAIVLKLLKERGLLHVVGASGMNFPETPGTIQ